MASLVRVLAPFVLVALVACEQPTQDAAGGGEEIPGPAPSATAGKIAGDTITVGEVDAWIKDQLFKQATRAHNPMKVYEVRNRAFEQMANERALDEMAHHTLHKPEGREADQAFHAALLAATANPFVISLTKGVTAAVDALSQYKLRISKGERNAVPDHVRVYDAIASKDAEGAREAMIRLIRLAVLDMPPKQRPRPPAGSSMSDAAYFMPAAH